MVVDVAVPSLDDPDAFADAEAAASHLRSALERVGFLVERDFEHWVPERTARGVGVVRIGRLSVTTADRLWRVLDRCSTLGLRVSRAAEAVLRSPARVTARHRMAQVPDNARKAAGRLRVELMRVGFVVRDDFGGCVADVTASGLGLVLLGRLPAPTAHMLAELITRLLPAETGSATAVPTGVGIRP